MAIAIIKCLCCVGVAVCLGLDLDKPKTWFFIGLLNIAVSMET